MLKLPCGSVLAAESIRVTASHIGQSQSVHVYANYYFFLSFSSSFLFVCCSCCLLFFVVVVVLVFWGEWVSGVWGGGG